MVLTGRVAWFDIKKQFGFVKVAGLRDTFLHMAVLKEAGYTFVPAGTTLRFTAGKSAGKPRIDEIHSVDTSTAERGQPDRFVPTSEHRTYPAPRWDIVPWPVRKAGTNGDSAPSLFIL